MQQTKTIRRGTWLWDSDQDNHFNYIKRGFIKSKVTLIASRSIPTQPPTLPAATTATAPATAAPAATTAAATAGTADLAVKD